ncbi:MAG: TRAP transporter small permease [Thermoanaerobacteraceae bacterium]|nr:TRAP transporter small permease [Thermoanaerobacteraceae bacterium]
MGSSDFKQRLLEIDSLVAGISIVVLVVITCAGVVKRYFINDPIVWLEEIQVWLFLWLTFFGGSIAFRTKSHVVIEILVDMMPKMIQKYVGTIVYIMSMFVLVYLFIKCNLLLQLFITTNKTTNVLRIPSSIQMGGVLFGVFLMILNYTIVIIKELKSQKGGDME